MNPGAGIFAILCTPTHKDTYITIPIIYIFGIVTQYRNGIQDRNAESQ